MNRRQRQLFDPQTLEPTVAVTRDTSADLQKPLALLSIDEIFDRASQGLLESLREDNRLEYKPAGFHHEHLTMYINMWANTAPDGGLLVLGVEEAKKQFIWRGCGHLGSDELNRIEHPQKDMTIDLPECRAKRVPFNREGRQDFLVLIRVFHRRGRRLLRTPKNKVYVRRGDQIKELTSAELRNAQLDIGEVDFEQEPCGLAYPGAFDETAIHQFCDAVRSELELAPGQTDERILSARHLGEFKGGSFVPNVTCALMFALEPDRIFPGCRIQFFQFSGTTEGAGEKFHAIKDPLLEGLTVPKLIQAAEKLLESQIRQFRVQWKDGRFYAQPEYPKAAWYEAIVNACAHRSYGNGLSKMMVFIKMFEDRLEIESPGGFLPYVDPKNIYGMSCPRNPNLMHAMRFLKLVKMCSEGTRRMRDTMQELNLPEPEFSQEEIGHCRVKVVLRNDIKHRSRWIDAELPPVVGAVLARMLNENQKRILNFVAEHKAINVSQAVRLTGLDWGTAKKAIVMLVDMGVLKREGRDDIDRDPHAKYVFGDNL